MNNEKRGVLSIFENCLDVVINAVAIFAAYTVVLLFYDPVIMLTDYKTLVAIFLVLFVSMTVYQTCNTYKRVPFVGDYSYIIPILKANVIVYGVALLVFLLTYRGYVRGFVLLWGAFSLLFSTAALIFKKSLIIKAVRAIRRKSYTVRRAIIVGDNLESANAFLRHLAEDRDSSLVIIGALGRRMREGMLCDNLGDFEDLEQVLDSYKPDDVIFAIDSYDKESLISMVNKCDDRCIKVYFLPVIYGFFKSAQQIDRVGGMPIINAHSTPLDSRYNRMIKRLFDIVGSLVLIVLCSPLMLAVAIGVRLSSDGPVIFKQRRIGFMGKPFTILKFRSMYVTEGQDKTWSDANDSRKTRFGAFLRRSSFDELPQLFNVLKGDMSLVGPRPEMPHFVESFRNRVPLYMIKHYVKPGMTGLAQVKGLRGDTSVEKRILEDIAYIEGWSLFLDLVILLKTPFKAYNSEERYVQSELDDENSGSDMIFSFSTMRAECAPSASSITGVSDQVKKRVLYCASSTSHIDNFHRDYIGELKKRGHTVDVLACGDGADIDIPIEKRMISRTNLRAIRKIKRVIAEGEYDTVVLNTSLAAFLVRLALPSRKRPRVINFVHGYLFSSDVGALRSRALYLCERLLARRTDEIIVMNMHDYRVAVRKKLARERVCFVKGMGAEVREIITPPDQLRRRYSCEQRYVMTFVGELSARKNQEFLIRALAALKKSVPQAVLWLVGDGAIKSDLGRLACELGVSDSVMFMGARADACDYIRAADLYVSASSTEGMPFNVIEALGCGATVVASAVKGHIDLISNGKDGHLYYFNNCEDFITKVYKIYSGSLKIDKSNVLAKYEKYTKGTVFTDTFAVLLSAILAGGDKE